MFQKYSLILILALIPCISSAELKFFSKSINYWNQQKQEEKNIQQPQKEKKKEKVSKSFPWHKYHNPEYKEFWKEGKHTTPAAVAETARVVSDKNATDKQKRKAIENYKKWIKIKNQLHENFTKALITYSNDRTNKLPSKSREYLKIKSQNMVKATFDNEKIAFTMYFRSTCPQCKRMFQTFRELHKNGFYVEAKQVDRGRLKNIKLPYAIIPASKEEVQKLSSQGITGVPFTLIFIGGKQVIPVQGYKSPSEIYNIIRSKLAKGGTG